MARLKVGDKVVIVEHDTGDDSDAYVGRIGVIKEDDGTARPYCVKFEGCHAWCREEQVRPAPSSSTYKPTPGKPVTSFEVGKWYQWVNGKVDNGINDRDSSIIESGNPLHFVKGSESCGRFEELEQAWAFSTILEHFREVPAPSQGHEHSVPSGVFSTFQHQICIVDTKRRTVTIAATRPVATRSAIRRRLLNLE